MLNSITRITLFFIRVSSTLPPFHAQPQTLNIVELQPVRWVQMAIPSCEAHQGDVPDAPSGKGHHFPRVLTRTGADPLLPG
jgi:hypothetical protein